LSAESALYVALAALAGLLIGSFLNVCIYRLPKDLSVVRPRSFCPECGKPIAWYDNIPILSFALLKGRCRACGKLIGIRYLFVELTTAALFGATVARFGCNLVGLKWCLFEAIMIVLFWTDLEEGILPDEFTLGGSALGLLFAFVTKVPGGVIAALLPSLGARTQSLLEALAGAFVLTVPLTAVGFIWSKVSKREALGMGDVKLLPCIGLFLGLSAGFETLLVGSVLGSVLGGLYIFITKKKFLGQELPLGAYYCGVAALAPLLFVAKGSLLGVP
jgi:leader peptidase (prepilin peptidase)/N-methyltransferase